MKYIGCKMSNFNDFNVEINPNGRNKQKERIRGGREIERERQKRKKREQKKDGVNAKRGHLQSFGTTVSKH